LKENPNRKIAQFVTINILEEWDRYKNSAKDTPQQKYYQTWKARFEDLELIEG